MVAALLASSGMCIRTQAQVPCPRPAGVRVIQTLRDLPEPVRRALQSEARRIVDHGEPFDSTDVVQHGGRFNRFGFAWQKGSRYILVTERGGFVATTPLYVVRWSAGQEAQLEAARIVRRGEVCRQARAALDEPPARSTPVQKKTQ